MFQGGCDEILFVRKMCYKVIDMLISGSACTIYVYGASSS